MTGVVIVNWNGVRLLDACLTAVYEQKPSPDLVVMVDNGSSDHSVEHLRARWPAVRVVALEKNLGVAAGNNVGIGAALEAGVTHVLLLNNDATLGATALDALHEALSAAGEDAWAAAPKILYRNAPDRIWSAGGSFDWWRGVSRDRGTDEIDRGQFDAPSDIDYSNTCCLLIRADTFRRVGLMDEAYFMYYDDSDFSARVRRAGGRILYVPAARVLHDVQGSSGGTTARPSLFALYYTTRNRARFIRRNAPNPLQGLFAHVFTLGSRIIRVGQALVAGRWAEAQLVCRALQDGYLRRETGMARRPLGSGR